MVADFTGHRFLVSGIRFIILGIMDGRITPTAFRIIVRRITVIFTVRRIPFRTPMVSIGHVVSLPIDFPATSRWDCRT